MAELKDRPPLVYSCSGCSSAAQMANHLALRLDRDGAAEMSCIAGVGGGVPGLVKTARSGRKILALDGCVLACARACLAREGLTPDRHVVLSEFGVKKRKHADFDPAEAAPIYERHILPAARDLGEESAKPGD
ncbi:MAG TPA: putative zinc-binding protein [Steroidobacteraceae bacterium]